MMKLKMFNPHNRFASDVAGAGRAFIRLLASKRWRGAMGCFLVLAMLWNLVLGPLAKSTASGERETISSTSTSSTSKASFQTGGLIIWGPQDVVRQPINTTYTANFSLPAGALAPYTMTVSNGAPDGTRKVTSACVRINGVAVLATACNHSINPSPQTRTVTLQQDNTITVTLVGSSLSYITITITGSAASLAVSPTSGSQGQTLAVTMTGSGTNWASGQTVANFGGEIAVNSLTVNSVTSATAQITVSPTAALGPRTITMTTGSEIINAVDGFTVNAASPPGAASSTVSTLAGTAGTPGFVDGTGAAARFRQLAGLAAAPNEVVYVADAGNHAIRRVDAAGAVTTTAGDGLPGFVDAQGTSAEFNNPQGVAIDAQGNLYVADTGNHSIRRIDTSGNVTTLAGDGTSGFVNGTGAVARFNGPRGVAVDTLGRIYVADTGNHAVRRIDSLGNVTTIAGDGTAGSSNAAPVRFNGLAGIAADGTEIYLYIADGNNHRIRRLDNNNTVITLAGLDRGFKDGTAAESRFADPTGIAVDGAGHVIVADSTNSLIRQIDPVRAINGESSAVFTLAGTGARGAADGAGNAASFNKPAGAAVLASGAVIVADTANQSLRKILAPPTIASINPAQGAANATVTLTGTRFDARGPSFNTVRFTAAGGGTVSATVSTATSRAITVSVPATAATGTVTVQTAGGISNAVNFTVQAPAQPPVIADFNPKTGPVGTIVTLTGTNLKNGGVDPAVSFQGPNSTRLPAQVNSSSAAQVVVIVPNGAVTGLIDLTTSLGTAQSPSAFIIESTQDYSLTLLPSSKTMVQGGKATYVVSATSPQSNFTQLIKLSATGLPAGITAAFEPAQITAGSTSTLSLTIPDNQTATSYSFSVQGVAKIDGADVARTASGSLTVLSRNGQTTLSGRVLSTDEKPIQGAVVSVGSVSTNTDAAGAFLLTGVSAGAESKVLIDATNIPGFPAETYPVITEPAAIVAGQANAVSYIFYLPRIDWADPGTKTIPLNGDTVASTVTVSNTKIPNLEMTIPAGTRIIGRNGQPITRASITPVPIDRVPAPLPSTFELSPGNTIKIATQMVFTSQPGSALVTSGVVPVTYPNLGGANPGASVPLFKFDHDQVKWVKYGDGTVSADGKRIVPNPGVGLTDFAWHFVFEGLGLDPNDPECGNQTCTPVDLSTGIKIERMTDIAFGGARGGLALTRVYTSEMSNPSNGVQTRFGRGTADNFSIRLSGSFTAGGSGRVLLPEHVSGRLFSYSGTDNTGALIFRTTSAVSQLGDIVRRLSSAVSCGAGAQCSLEYRTVTGLRRLFDNDGRLRQIIDRNANTTTLTYDSSNKLSVITDPVGRTITLEYNRFGSDDYVVSATDPLGRKTRYTYEFNDGRGFSWLLRSVIDPSGDAVTYSYNEFNLLRQVKDARNNPMKRVEYYLTGDGDLLNTRVKSQTFPDGSQELYEYSFSARIVTKTKITQKIPGLPDRVTTRRFDANGRPLGATDALGQSVSIVRNPLTGVQESTVGPCGCVEGTREYYTRTENGQEIKTFLIKKQTNKLNQSVEFEYHPVYAGITKFTDQLGRVTTLEYDANGNLSWVRNPLNHQTDFTYDRGMLTSITTPPANAQLGRITITIEYDANGFPQRRIDGAGHIVRFEYDAIGRLKKVTDALLRETTFNYDDSDRLISVSQPAIDPVTNTLTTSITTYEYDPNGNQIAIKDHLGREWKMAYDTSNRLEAMTDPIGRVRRWEYNGANELIKTSSPGGRTMRYEYDERGLRTKMVDGLGGEVVLGYDYVGNLQTVRDQRSNITTFAYDPLYRLQSRRDPLGRLASVEYDPVGNVKVATDRLGRRTEIDYDVLNRPWQARYADGAIVTYAYDPAGRPTSVSDSQSGQISWEFDKATRLIKETTPQGIVDYEYFDDDQRKSLKVTGRPQVDYTYDAAGQLKTISQSGETFTYGYDLLGRRTSLQRPNGVTTSYEYDELHRLKRLVHAGGAVPEDLQYRYSPDGEIEQITSAFGSTQLPQTRTIGTADAANRISTFNGANTTFDNEGQPTAIGTGAYQWDVRGRLKQVALPGQTVGYGYDALGRRTSRTDSAGTVNYQYDGLEVIADRAGSTTIDYLNGPGIDEKLRQSGGAGGTFYFLQDHLNSIIGLVGSVNERYQYDAFGGGSGSSWTRYGYTGRERDSATGLLFYRARWYDAQQGRFLTEDPIGMQGGLNLYSYVGNNPLSFADPLGLLPWRAFLCGFANAFLGALVVGALIGAGFALLPAAAAASIGLGMAAAGVFMLGYSLGQTGAAYLSGDITGNQFAFALGEITGNLAGGALGGAAGYLAGVSAAGGTSSVSSSSTVYRVQGGTLPAASQTRISIGNQGQMTVSGEGMLYVTFNDLARAVEFRNVNRPGAEIISFEVDPAFVSEVQAAAVPQAQGRAFPGAPQMADPSKTSNSFGLPRGWIDRLIKASRPGTGKIQKCQ